MDLTRLLAVLVVVTAALAPISAGSLDAQNGDVRIRVVAPTVPIDAAEDELEVSVVVEDVANLGGFQFTMSYDPNVLNAASVQKTDFLGSSGREVVCAEPQFEEGVVRASCVSFRDSPPGVSGSGEILVVKFEPRGAGTTELELKRVKLARIDGTQVEVVSALPATITISGGSSWRPPVTVVAGAVLTLAALGAVAGIRWLRRNSA